MPSPPAPVRSSHQVTAAATEAGSGGVDEGAPRGSDEGRCSRGEAVGKGKVPAVVVIGPGPALGRKQLERRQLDAVQAGGGPDVAAVAVGERLRVADSRHGPGQQFGDIGPACGDGLEHTDRSGQRGAGGGADRGVLVAEELVGLDRPGQQLGVQQEPVGVELAPQSGVVDGSTQLLQQLLGLGRREERTPSTGVDSPRRAVAGTEPHRGDLGAAAEQDDGAGAMCFSSQITCSTPERR